jgi:hypothetical protein
MHQGAQQAGGTEPPRRPKLEVADILRAYAPLYLEHHAVSFAQYQVLEAIMACRTPALGGHLQICDSCGYQQVAYNSCRNRHCPKCQALAQASWVEQRKERVLPVNHFHVVFTLPAPLRPLCLRNPRTLYDLLFETASQTLLDFGRDPQRLGAQLGVTAVLHTWTQRLAYHPHLHCIVTGGGLSTDGQRWVPTPGKILFPVFALGMVFRAKFLTRLRKLYLEGELDLGGPLSELEQVPAFEALMQVLFQTKWVVYAKRPLGGAKQVFSYLGRYTHRVGLSNYRLRALDGQGVHFSTKDGKTCTLLPLEFIRRFLLHVLPRGFVKIRHYGLLSSANAKTKLEQARRLLEASSAAVPPTGLSERKEAQQEPQAPAAAPERADFVVQMEKLAGIDLTRCPLCQTGRMVSFVLAHCGGKKLPRGRAPVPAQGGTLSDSS